MRDDETADFRHFDPAILERMSQAGPGSAATRFDAARRLLGSFGAKRILKIFGARTWNECRLQYPMERPNLQGAEFQAANLQGANLRGANLQGANLQWANLQDADLTDADLQGADLRHANFWHANLQGGNLRVADLSGVDLQGAKLKGVDFQGADLRGSKFTTEPASGAGSASFLDLATCSRIETATFSEPDFFPQYLARAFEFAHRSDTEDAQRWPYFVARTLEKIKTLRALYPDSAPPPALIEAVQTITAELIEYLAKHPEALYEIKPRQFEELIAEILASCGWQVHLTKATRDGGYDLFAISKDQAGVETSWLIECKRYRKDRKVGIDLARALYGVRYLSMRAEMLMFATTSFFSKEVQALKASRYDLELKDYEGILEWLNEYRPNPDGRLYIKDNRLVFPGETD